MSEKISLDSSECHFQIMSYLKVAFLFICIGQYTFDII